jgi:small redox-active disulfide protein 2
MKKIVVYGPGCNRCKETEKVVRDVLAETGAEVDFQAVHDMMAMAEAGILATPAVTVDGVVKVSGRIPKPAEVKTWL